MCRFVFRYWLVGLIYALGNFQVEAQNLTWVRFENADNSDFINANSSVLQLQRDSAGDIYALLKYDEHTSVNDDNQFVRVFSATRRGYMVVKYSAAGELLWYKNFEVFSNLNPKISVTENGKVILAGEVSESYDFDFDFEGERFVTTKSENYFFFVWMDTDGQVTNWKLSNDVEPGFRIQTVSSIILLDDGRFWFSGGFVRSFASAGLTRHDIEFVNLYGTDGKIKKSNKFDAGPHGNFPTKWFRLDDFQRVNGKIYMRATGNGFYGVSRGDVLAGKQHEFILSINPSNNVDLELSVTDVEDNILDMVAHTDGSFSVVASSPDGILNTSIGNIPVNISNANFLANIQGTSLQGSIPLPSIFLKMRKFENDDDRLVVYGNSGLPIVVPDGEGNEFTTSGRQFIGFYKKSGILTFYDSYDEISPNATAGVEDVLADANCNALYVGGYSYDVIDYDLSDDAELLSSGRSSGINYFFGKYNNERPQIISPDTLKVCEGEDLLVALTIVDEASDLLTLTFSSPNGDFDPNRIITSGSGINRLVDLSNLGVSGEVLMRVRALDICGDFIEKDILIQSTPFPEAPILSVTNEHYLCPGDTLELTSNTSEANTWSDGSTSDTLRITEAGTYSLIQTNETGCVSPSSEILTVIMAQLPETPLISVSGPLEICQGETIILTSSVTEGNIWSTGEMTPSISVSEAGLYTVYQTSEYCGDSDFSIPVEVIIKDAPAKPLITIDGDSRFCEGGAVTLRSTEADSYLWSNGATTQEIIVQNSGSYWLSSTVDDCESPSSDIVDILVDEDFDLFIKSDTSVCSAFNSIELIPEVSLPNLDYLWSDGSGMSTLQLDEAGNYWVEVSNGTCLQKAFVRVEEVCYPILYVPSAFSPNGDGTNDVFTAIGVRIIDFGMIVYNQWGIQIFASNSIDSGWDGTFNGQKVPEGQYVYHIVYSGLINDQTVNLSKRGGMSLLR